MLIGRKALFYSCGTVREALHWRQGVPQFAKTTPRQLRDLRRYAAALFE